MAKFSACSFAISKYSRHTLIGCPVKIQVPEVASSALRLCYLGEITRTFTQEWLQNDVYLTRKLQNTESIYNHGVKEQNVVNIPSWLIDV